MVNMKSETLRTLVIFGIIVAIGIFIYSRSERTTSPSEEFDLTNQAALDLADNETTTLDPSENMNRQASVDCPSELTKQQTEGPYYKPGSPEMTDLTTSDIAGKRITIQGYVFDEHCQRVAGAWLDVWQADGKGVYDTVGYKLRGHQFTDAEGKYSITTVIPGEYPGRTPHIHIKLRATDDSPIVTSQLYFPTSARNQADWIFDPTLLVTLDEMEGKKIAYFNFKLESN